MKEWLSDLMMVLKWLLIKIVCALTQGVSVKSVPKVPEVGFSSFISQLLQWNRFFE